MKTFAYPSLPASAGAPKGLGLRLLLAAFESRKILRRRAAAGDRVEMHPLADAVIEPLGDGDIPLVFLCHNDRRFLPSLLAHYRSLGVTRFICVDDRSSDGSREYLAAEPDVDVWTSTVRYRDARRGRLWREWLFAHYGADRWYLNIDADEYLVYDGCRAAPLSALIAALEARGERRMAAPMIDLYPAGPVENFAFDGKDARMPWEIADHFDAEGYQLTFMKRFMSLAGGPRRRLFDSDLELMKYPLLYWDGKCSLGVSIHQPTPFERNFGPIGGVLLHFKFFSDHKSRTEQAVADNQYFDGAREYRRMLETADAGGLDFSASVSRRYEGPRQLREAGFMTAVLD